MSGVQKAPGNVELKPPDKGEQPMDLAPRTAHQHAVAAAKPTQLQVTTIGPALRPHLDTAKSAFTTLGQRLPAPPRPVLQPAISVSSTGGNVIAAPVTPSYTVKSVGGSSVPQLSTLRHMVTPSATGVSSPNAGTIVTSMASIIRSNTITTTQIGHTASHQFSSHVPRGPAAVASINTAPKSALATPMLRSSMGQANTAPHIPVGQARAAGLVPARAAFAAMPRSASLAMAQVMDLQKPYGVPRSGSHGGAGQVQIGFASGRSLEPMARTTLGHSSVSIAKSLHVTQPIVHSLHQVPEKPFKCNTSPATVQYTTVPGLVAGTTGHSAVIPSSPSPLTTSNSSTASCGATIVSPHAQVVQPSVPIRSNMGTMSLVTLAPTSAVQSAPQVVATSQPASLHGSNLATAGSGIHPIFTVVSNKSPLSVAPASTAPSIGLPQSRLAGASRLATTAAPAVQPTSVQVAGSATRPVTTTVAIHPPTMSVPTVSVVKTRPEDASKDDRRFVPGTKVFGPTSLVGSTAGVHSSAGLEAAATVSEPTGNLFVTGATARNLATTISSASSNAATTASPLPATVVISDTRTDRPAQLQGAAATPSYAVPTTYLYDPGSYPIQGATITMHPYAAATPAGVTPVFPVASARPSRE
uniref:Putative mucin-5ac n=1 Tax=Rhipicephalus pulchellus TaxID=72859 RepID=L7M200_RHIPC